MNKLFVTALLFVAAGCCSYSELKTDCGGIKVDGEKALATYEVVNVSYKLLGLVPLTTGITWKSGPYRDGVGSAAVFMDKCSLDDNLASVRHACETVGGGKIANVVGRDDVYNAWSLFLIRKEVLKTSCVILAP